MRSQTSSHFIFFPIPEQLLSTVLNVVKISTVSLGQGSTMKGSHNRIRRKLNQAYTFMYAHKTASFQEIEKISLQRRKSGEEKETSAGVCVCTELFTGSQWKDVLTKRHIHICPYAYAHLSLHRGGGGALVRFSPQN